MNEKIKMISSTIKQTSHLHEMEWVTTVILSPDPISDRI